MAKTFSYGKKEKLKRRKLLDEIFSNGKTFTNHPIKIFYLQPLQPLDFPVKAGVGVSSKYFKKAVHRNRIKRLLREAYRTEKILLHEYLNTRGKQVIIFILYIDKVLPDYAAVKTKMQSALNRLIKQLNETGTSNT